MAADADVIVIGTGPAGLAAAIEARRRGAGRVVAIERDEEPGGILQQCIHPGFGLHLFGEDLTGPEYAWRFIREAREVGVELMTGTMALSVGQDRSVLVCGRSCGMVTLRPEALVLATGCRERTRGAIRIPGMRPAGVMTAGTAQRLINMEGLMPGRSVVILGSGDIGLIMARRMTLEGAVVHAVLEARPWPGGLTRNIVQCLDDFSIPLHLSSTVIGIEGRERVTAVVWAKVDEKGEPVPGTEVRQPCDTLLLSVGLIPENELAREAGVPLCAETGGPAVDSDMQTGIPGIFACGNSVQVHDLADRATEEARICGRAAADWALGLRRSGGGASTKPGRHIRQVVPARLLCGNAGEVRLSFRVNEALEGATVRIRQRDRVLYERRRPILVPGEMEQAILPTASMAMLDADEPVVVEIL